MGKAPVNTLLLPTSPPNAQTHVVVTVWSLTHAQFFATPWTVAHQASLSFTVFWSSLKFMPNESVVPSKHLILCHPLLLLHSIFVSTKVFFNELALHIRWPKYWSFSNSPSNEYSGLISFRIDWFDLCAVQGTLHSLLQHQSESINCLALSLLYGPTFISVQNHSVYKNIFFQEGIFPYYHTTFEI